MKWIIVPILALCMTGDLTMRTDNEEWAEWQYNDSRKVQEPPIPEHLYPLEVNISTEKSPNSKEYRLRAVITPTEHRFEHDRRYVYYNGAWLPDSDCTKDVKVVVDFYEQIADPRDVLMSAMPPMRFNHILYISNNGNLYFQAMKMEGADPDNFEQMNVLAAEMRQGSLTVSERPEPSNTYIKSNGRVYYRGKWLEGLNIRKFHLIYGAMSIYGYPKDTYAGDGSNVYYMGERIRGAHAPTFTLFHAENSIDFPEFSKDKNCLYFKGERVKGIDGSTFVSLGSRYFKDKNGVYMFSSLPQCSDAGFMGDGSIECDGERYFCLNESYRDALLNLKEMETAQGGADLVATGIPYFGPHRIYVALKCIEADPETFEIIDPDHNLYYSKDAYHVFMNGKIIEGANPKNFTVYSNTDYIVDNRHVYYRGEIVPDADVATFRPMADIYRNYGYFRDRNHIYQNGQKVKGLSAANYDVSGFYYKKGGKVWLRIPYGDILLFQIKEADPQTFVTYFEEREMIPCSYAKDCANAYYRGTVIPGAHAGTFEPFGNSGYAYDSKNLYFNGRLIKRSGDFNSSGFRVISLSDPEEEMDVYLRSAYAEDNRYIYYNGTILSEKITGETLHLYNRDSNHPFNIYAYYNGKIFCRGKLIKVGAKDSIRLYHYGPFTSPFWSDSWHIYYEDKQIADVEEGVRVAGFDYGVVGGKRAFYKDREMDTADGAALWATDVSGYAKDLQNVYFEGVRQEGINPDDFYPLRAKGYAKYGNRIYYNGRVPESIDAAKITTQRIGIAHYLMDGTYIYYEGIRYKKPKESRW